MKKGNPHSRVLYWYPLSWRERHGEELLQLVADVHGEGALGLRNSLELARSGLKERIHAHPLMGSQATTDPMRSGSLIVFCAWAIFVLAGASFSKLSEHFAQSVSMGISGTAQVAYDVVVTLGVIGCGLVACAGLVALRSIISLIVEGHAREVAKPFAVLVTTTFVFVGLLVFMKTWAHGLTFHARNGGDWKYSMAFLGLAVVFAFVIAEATALGVALGARLRLSSRALRTEAKLATALAAVMLGITGATAVWWVSMAHEPSGFVNSPTTLVVTTAMMTIGCAVAMCGLVRLFSTDEPCPISACSNGS